MVLSKVQKYQFICVIILLCFTVIFANENQVLKFYQSNEFSKIHSLLTQDKIADSDWAEFSRLLFEADGESAFSGFIALHKKTDDTMLRRIIVDRLSQYYYAKGLYNAANRVIDDAKFLGQISHSNIQKIYFGVQVGAYSTHRNAMRARKKFEKVTQNIFIVSKTKKGKKLYTVVLGKFSSRDDAKKMKAKIARSMQQSGMIIQY